MKISLVPLVGFVFVVWLSAPLVLTWLLPTWSDRGQFGDLFGSVNALFSGLAFAGLFWSMQMQREQLDLQRKELSLQRDELRLQREEMKASRAELSNQVAAQMALVKATNAQIAVAGVQAEITWLTMKAEMEHPLQRDTYLNEIKIRAASLSALSDRLENAFSEVPPRS